jgi:hypothetical protein
VRRRSKKKRGRMKEEDGRNKGTAGVRTKMKEKRREEKGRRM